LKCAAGFYFTEYSKPSREYCAKITYSPLGFVIITSPVHTFKRNVIGQMRSSRLSRNKNSKLALRVGEEVDFISLDEDVDMVLEIWGTDRKGRSWTDW